MGAWRRPVLHGAHSAISVQGPLVVTEELHLITFTLAYAYCGLELELEVRAGDFGGGWGGAGVCQPDAFSPHRPPHCPSSSSPTTTSSPAPGPPSSGSTCSAATLRRAGPLPSPAPLPTAPSTAISAPISPSPVLVSCPHPCSLPSLHPCVLCLSLVLPCALSLLLSPVPALSWSLSHPHPLVPSRPCPLPWCTSPALGTHPQPCSPRLPQEQQFFSAPPPAPWRRLAEVLSWQFESVAERGLSKEHLLMLAEKLFGKAGCQPRASWGWDGGRAAPPHPALASKAQSHLWRAPWPGPSSPR